MQMHPWQCYCVARAGDPLGDRHAPWRRKWPWSQARRETLAWRLAATETADGELADQQQLCEAGAKCGWRLGDAESRE
jgi:hypothetical protein